MQVSSNSRQMGLQIRNCQEAGSIDCHKMAVSSQQCIAHIVTCMHILGRERACDKVPNLNFVYHKCLQMCAVVYDRHRQQYNVYQTRSISRRATLTAKRREAISTLQSIKGRDIQCTRLHCWQEGQIDCLNIYIPWIIAKQSHLSQSDDP